MTKNFFYLLMLICVFTSCSPYTYMSVDNNMKKVIPGMTKEEVISIMGKDYEVINFKDETYTLGYKTYDDGIYKLLFIDGKLKEWNKEWFRGQPYNTRKFK